MQLQTQRVLIFVVTLFLAFHAFFGLLTGVLKLMANFTFKVLLQGSPSNQTTKPTAAGEFLRSLNYEVIDEIIVSALEIYKALVVCCVSCCDLNRMLQVMSGVLVLFLLNASVNIFTVLYSEKELRAVVDDLEDNFLTNFYNLYNDTHGMEANARFTFEMNSIQGILTCCGVNSYLEYANASLWKAGPGQNLTVPPTCCRLDRRPFLYINCVIFLQGACMYDPTLDNSSIGRGCFQVIQTALRAILIESLVWNISSLLLYFTILFLFFIQIRMTTYTKKDPYEGLRDGGFLKATQQFVDEMDLVDEKAEQEERRRAHDKKNNGKKKSGSSGESNVDEYRQELFVSVPTSKCFYDVVVLATDRKKERKLSEFLENSDLTDSAETFDTSESEYTASEYDKSDFTVN